VWQAFQLWLEGDNAHGRAAALHCAHPANLCMFGVSPCTELTFSAIICLPATLMGLTALESEEALCSSWKQDGEDLQQDLMLLTNHNLCSGMLQLGLATEGLNLQPSACQE